MEHPFSRVVTLWKLMSREALGLGLRRLDEIDLVEQFQRRPCPW